MQKFMKKIILYVTFIKLISYFVKELSLG